MKARTFYDLDQEEKWKVWNAMSSKYECDENDEPILNWILKRAHESRPPRVDEQQLQEVQELYERRIKESEERSQQQFQKVQQRALRAESLYSVMQSQVATLYEHLGMPPHPPPKFPLPPSLVVSPPPHVSHRIMMIEATT
ncbi:hypothetical protein ACLB2K_032384 [Fragaria x ananassa]